MHFTPFFILRKNLFYTCLLMLGSMLRQQQLSVCFFFSFLLNHHCTYTFI